MSVMDHQRAKELFSQYLEGDLPPEQQSEIEAHLDQCQTCKVEMEALEKTLSSLAGLAAVPPPKDFDRKVQQRIRRRSRGRFFAPENLLNRIPFEWISFIVIMSVLKVRSLGTFVTPTMSIGSVSELAGLIRFSAASARNEYDLRRGLFATAMAM